MDVTWRIINNNINTLHERCIRITDNGKQKNVQELLDKDESVSIHSRNLQTQCSNQSN